MMNRIDIARKRVFSGYDGKMCKVDPKLMSDGRTYVMTYTMLLLSGSDVFYDNFAAISTDGGKSFREPIKLSSSDAERNGIRSHIAIISTYYNKVYEKWFIFGMRMLYDSDSRPIEIGGISVGIPVVTTFDTKTNDWDTNFKEIPMPFKCVSACCHGQVIEYPNGEMLLSYYLTKEEDGGVASVMTVRYTVIDGEFKIVKAGAPIKGVGYSRGYCEPSVAMLNNKYYMTIRTDEAALLSESDDGFTFVAPKKWAFDNEKELESYNTMQRWVRFKDGLYLAYTRKDKINEHVFRNRAPMYMTRFDEEKKCLMKDEEIILVPELGARLGNYSVLDVSDDRAILTTAEWMQPEGCEKYGSDNSIWMVNISKIRE